MRMTGEVLIKFGGVSGKALARPMQRSRFQMNTAIRERPQPSESVRSGALEALVKDFACLLVCLSHYRRALRPFSLEPFCQ